MISCAISAVKGSPRMGIFYLTSRIMLDPMVETGRRRQSLRHIRVILETSTFSRSTVTMGTIRIFVNKFSKQQQNTGNLLLLHSQIFVYILEISLFVRYCPLSLIIASVNNGWFNIHVQIVLKKLSRWCGEFIWDGEWCRLFRNDPWFDEHCGKKMIIHWLEDNRPITLHCRWKIPKIGHQIPVGTV